MRTVSDVDLSYPRLPVSFKMTESRSGSDAGGDVSVAYPLSASRIGGGGGGGPSAEPTALLPDIDLLLGQSGDVDFGDKQQSNSDLTDVHTNVSSLLQSASLSLATTKNGPNNLTRSQSAFPSWDETEDGLNNHSLPQSALPCADRTKNSPNHPTQFQSAFPSRHQTKNGRNKPLLPLLPQGQGRDFTSPRSSSSCIPKKSS